MILSPDLHDIESTAHSDAERRVARLLKDIPNVDAVAFHSVNLRSHQYKQMAEVDFVILWKGVAIIVEVKGGGVQKFEGVWYSVDRKGDSHRLATSPMEQAQSAMFALKKILEEDGLGWFPAVAVVITPDIEAPPPSHEWKATNWLANETMTAVSLAGALDVIARSAPTAPRNAHPARVDDIRVRLFGAFSRLPVIDAQRGAVIDEQNTATNEQARVLAGLAKIPRLVVFGGAGTGKSVVLAEAAKQDAEAGRTVLVTFRSPGLRSFFEPRLSGRGIEITEFAALTPSKQFDVVLVDEAQDLMSADAMDLLERVMIGGRSQGRWRMFLDHNNQAHLHGRFDPDVLELVLADAMECDLSKNVRNTRAIVHMVQEYLGADVGDPGIVNGERIQWKWIVDNKTFEPALELARSLKGDGVRPADIWVIPVSADHDLDELHDGFRVLSPRVSKGLEAEHVIVCELPTEYGDESLAAFYVAATRARVTLHVVASEPDKKRLRSLESRGGRRS
ncbi:nuclease-related domain-containing DEAD/DEAH box helicase [Subtercola endophyticus]|uniref:nuclease-related domain-containing DEAD/DEAH box helicase n=1 Tax=Subtercola endophyticus TaxID=2895559 RepID=UPI001E39127F|nr:NERD domain-containing protein/DEAD/DEAH box helicase [Subtercola endophyticus]UFS57594.1 NERD domain-containing protein/DEAD/DEAH box helicase [Subtercola endophyticus]